jgi:hypothetical protein
VKSIGIIISEIAVEAHHKAGCDVQLPHEMGDGDVVPTSLRNYKADHSFARNVRILRIPHIDSGVERATDKTNFNVMNLVYDGSLGFDAWLYTNLSVQFRAN